MKKLILLFTILSLIIISCKKDDQPTSATTIQGNWTVTSNNYYYYNSNGTLVYSETSQPGDDYTFTNTNCTLKGISSSYTLIKAVDSDSYLLSFGNTLISDINPLTVSFSNNEMNWKAESTKPNDLEYIQNGVSKTATKVSLSIILKKK